MPDKFLHGNGDPCPSCALRREAAHGIGSYVSIPCNVCDGTGRIARSPERIVAETVRQARLFHWNLPEDWEAPCQHRQ